MITPGDVIAELIAERGYKQGEFAEKIGIARSSLNRIIKGTKPLGKVNQSRIAHGLELPLSAFLFLINLGAPLDTYHVLLAVADLHDDKALTAIEKITTISHLIDDGKLPPDHLASIIDQIDSALKIVELLTT